MKETRWYTKKELKEIAEHYNVSVNSLCDVQSNGKKASGGYGCNIKNKLNLN